MTSETRHLLKMLAILWGWMVGCSYGPSDDARDAWIEEHRQRLEAGESSLSLYSTINTNVLLTQLAGMPEVESVSFDDTLDLSEKGLSQLKSFPNLRSLSFWGEPIVDNSTIHYIAECKGLETVSLVYLMKTHGVTEDGMRRLQESLPNCKISIKRYE